MPIKETAPYEHIWKDPSSGYITITIFYSSGVGGDGQWLPKKIKPNCYRLEAYHYLYGIGFYPGKMQNATLESPVGVYM